MRHGAIDIIKIEQARVVLVIQTGFNAKNEKHFVHGFQHATAFSKQTLDETNPGSCQKCIRLDPS